LASYGYSSNKARDRKSSLKANRPSLRHLLKGIYITLISLILLVFVIQATAQSKSLQKAAAPATASVSTVPDVTYPAAMFDNGKARHFEYKTSDGVRVRYFVMKSSDGVIRAALDACVVCWREGKGYVQDGDVMICKNCGKRFPSVKINEVTGGCNPVPLNRKVENGNVVIKAAGLEEGKKFFAFLGR
jgi:uncharacterized membrane protein